MSDPSECQVEVLNASAVSRLILSYIRPTMTLQPVKNLRPLSSRATCLAGTVPSHKAYVLLHGQHSPRAFPSRLASPLLVALRQRALRWSALVNVAWVPPNGSEHVPNLSEEETDGTETYSLLAFASNRRRLSIPSVSMDNFEDTCAQLNNFMERTSTGVVDPYGLYLYVCTHGARDCRCGEWGSKVADALREEIFKRRQTDPAGQYSRIVMGEVGHVGGHQSAYFPIVSLCCCFTQLGGHPSTGTPQTCLSSRTVNGGPFALSTCTLSCQN
jgi:hypothetical protein